MPMGLLMLPHLGDTIVALSSAAGPGVRAIVRVSGPNARRVIAAVFSTDVPATGSRSYAPGSLALSGVEALLPAELYFFRGPHTYTGQDLAELHTVSAPPLIERLIADLLVAGARAAQPGEFTMRAYLSGKKDLTQVEAVLAVIEATEDGDLQSALAQLAGGVSQPLAKLRDDLLNLLADVEAALDFVDEDIEFVTKDDTILRIGTGIAHLLNLKRQLDDRSVSRRPMRVALVGEPNAGKSSLFNAIVGADAALVSAKAGTTRDYLSHVVDLGGHALELIDTAGWQTAGDTIEAQAQSLGSGQSERADLVLVCVPVDSDAPERLPPRGVLLRTKADLGATEELSVSVVSHGGTDQLVAFLRERAAAYTRPALAPSQSRCRHHVDAAIADLRAAHEHAVFNDPPELLAVALRQALDQIGAMAGSIHTDDLLDRIFSRFCIGK